MAPVFGVLSGPHRGTLKPLLLGSFQVIISRHLGPYFWGHFGVIRKRRRVPFWGHLGVIKGAFGSWFWGRLGSRQGVPPFQSLQGLFLLPFGVVWGPFWHPEIRVVGAAGGGGGGFTLGSHCGVLQPLPSEPLSPPHCRAMLRGHWFAMSCTGTPPPQIPPTGHSPDPNPPPIGTALTPTPPPPRVTALTPVPPPRVTALTPTPP